jgi:hypothetical protein
MELGEWSETEHQSLPEMTWRKCSSDTWFDVFIFRGFAICQYVMMSGISPLIYRLLYFVYRHHSLLCWIGKDGGFVLAEEKLGPDVVIWWLCVVLTTPLQKQNFSATNQGNTYVVQQLLFNISKTNGRLDIGLYARDYVDRELPVLGIVLDHSDLISWL